MEKTFNHIVPSCLYEIIVILITVLSSQDCRELNNLPVKALALSKCSVNVSSDNNDGDKEPSDAGDKKEQVTT